MGVLGKAVQGKALIAAVWLAFCVDCAYPQENCDRTVKGVDGPQGYRPRDGRCEGLYWKAHAQESGLYLAGLTRGGAAERAALPDPVQLQWGKRPPMPPQTGVSIRSVLLRSDRYYQMDTSKPYSSGLYAWPTDVLRALQLAPKDLGIYAFTSVKIGRTPWKVYLPVTLGPPAAGAATYEVTLVPGTMLLNLNWQCTPIDASGIPATRKLASARLDKRFPAGEPIRVPIALPQFEGFCYVQITADPLSPTIAQSLHADFAFLASR